MVDVNKILIRIEADVNQLKSSMRKGTKEIKDFKNKSKKSFFDFKRIAETALGFGFANLMTSATIALTDFVKDGVKQALLFERGFKSLELQTGQTADSLIKDLKKASDGMISSLNLVQTANKALALGISQNQLPELMEVATARAKIMGISATQAFEDISIGIGRQSKLILDNLGIILDLDKSYENYAKTVGKTVGELTEFEKKQAITNGIISESGSLMKAMESATDDTLTKIEQFKASLSDLAQNTGTETLNILDRLALSIRGVAIEIDNSQELTPAAQEAFDAYGQAALLLEKRMQGARDSISGVEKSLKELSKLTVAGKAAFSAKEQKKMNQIDETRLKLLKLQQREKSDETENTKKINELQKQGLSLQDAVSIVRSTSTSEEERLTELLEKQREELEVIQLQRKVDVDNKAKLIELEGQAQAETLLNNEKTLKQIEDIVQGNINTLTESQKILASEKEITDFYSKKTDILQTQTKELGIQARKTKEIAFWTLAATEIVDKGKSGLQKAKQSFSSKNFKSLFIEDNRASASPVTSNNTQRNPISVIIENVYGTDPTEIANSLQNVLSEQIR